MTKTTQTPLRLAFSSLVLLVLATLGGCGEDGDPLEAQLLVELNHQDVNVRLKAVQWMQRRFESRETIEGFPKAAIDTLVDKSLHDMFPDVRIAAAEAIAAIGPEAVDLSPKLAIAFGAELHPDAKAAIEKALVAINKQPTSVIKGTKRPVPSSGDRRSGPAPDPTKGQSPGR